GYCDACPENRNASLRSAVGCGAAPSAASTARASRNCSFEPTTAAKRAGKGVRPLVLVKQISGNGACSQASPARGRSIDARSAASVLADSVNKFRSGSGVLSLAAGGSSSTTKAFVPPRPSELTAPSRG